jgi:hypothetical protein
VAPVGALLQVCIAAADRGWRLQPIRMPSPAT